MSGRRAAAAWPTAKQMRRWADDFWVGTGILGKEAEEAAQRRLLRQYVSKGPLGIWESKKLAGRKNGPRQKM
jgi:hypothetical protein